MTVYKFFWNAAIPLLLIVTIWGQQLDKAVFSPIGLAIKDWLIGVAILILLAVWTIRQYQGGKR